jgi:hypothetical protein
LLSNATVDSLSDGVLTLSFSREGDAKGFTTNGHDRALAKVLERMLGVSPQIRAVVGATNGVPAAAGPAAAPAVAGSGTGRGGHHGGDPRDGDPRDGDPRAQERQAPEPRAGTGAGTPRRLAVAATGSDVDADALTGADLVERELGGRVIEETGDS